MTAPRPTIAAHLHLRVQEAPQAIALSDGERRWTYAQLQRWALRLAARLAGAGVRRGERVAACLPRSPELVATFLATCELGAVYVPLDPEYPAARLALMLEDTEAAALVSTPALAAALPAAPTLVAAEDDEGPITRGDEEGEPDGLAAIIYTSGSTGRPKGVGLTHRALVGLATNPELFTVRAGEGVAQCANASFDAWLQEVAGALLGGGRLEIIPKETLLSASALGRALRERGVRTMFLPTGLFNQLGLAGPRSFQGVETVVVGGDVPDPRAVRGVLEVCRSTCIKNGYGPTEHTVFATYFSMARPEDVLEPIPIGRPLAGTEVLLLDEAGCPVKEGETGEVHLGGPSVAPGYWRAPELTAQRFLPHPTRPGERLYRTGDLARRDAQGVLHFAGRRDLQVKVRGFRVELEEIEAALGAHPGVSDRVVTAPTDRSGQRRLIAYYVPRTAPGPTPDELGAHLGARLPPFMVPTAVVRLDALPLTPNGKVDRAALPDPSVLGPRRAAPETPSERAVAALFAALLQVDEPSRDDDFFELGGHSLLVTRLLWRAEEDLGAVLSVRDIYEARTVAGIARRLDGVDDPQGAPREDAVPGPPGGELPVVRLPPDAERPLSFAQARLAFLEGLHPGGIAYNSAALVRLRGALDVAALEASVTALVARHEVLRSTVVPGAAGPVACVHPPYAPRIERIERPGVPVDAREEAAEALCREAAQRPFELHRLPLIRWLLVRFEVADHALLIVEHHVNHDGWSFNRLIEELFALYRAAQAGLPAPQEGPDALRVAAGLEALELHISDVAAWQRAFMATDAARAQIAYYVERLAGAPELTLPITRPRGETPSLRGRAPVLSLEEPFVARLRALAQAEGTTLFALMLTAFEVLLARYTGETDLVIGTSMANRRTRAAERVLGMLVNNVVLRVELGGAPTVREALQRVQDGLLGVLEHQDVPFEQVVEAARPARDPTKNPLFQIMFNFHGSPPPVIDVPGLDVTWKLPIPNGTSKTDLNVVCVPRQVGGRPDGIRMIFEHDAELFADEDIEQLIRAYRALLAQLPERIGGPLGALELLDAEALAEGLASSANPRPYPRDASLGDLFRAVAAARPDAVAVAWDGGASTYRDLDAASDALARRLVAMGAGPGERVAVLAVRGPGLVEALLGILKAGAAYVPLDPEYPPAHLQRMLQLARPVALVAAERPPWAPPDLTTLSLQGGQADPQVALPAVSAERPLYVMFTSGSTGEPRGVEVPHRAVVRLLFGVDYVQLDARQVILHHSPAAFDASTFELWAPLLHGGRVVLAPEGTSTPRELGALVRRHGVNTLWLTASLFNAVVDDGTPGFEGVEQLITGGEALSVQHVRRALERWPTARLVNGYGPTETTVFACCHVIPRPLPPLERIPIGRPIANTRAYVLDGAGRMVPPGVPGELHLAGDGLALRYVGREALTAERFVEDPFFGGRMYRTGDRVVRRGDGLLDFLGRADHQVKVRGFRIELEHVEQAVLQVPGVRGAGAVVHGEAGAAQLVVYFEGTGGEPSTERVERHLEAQLPKYMRPSRVVPMDRLPKTAAGKVDRRALSERPSAPAPAPSRQREAQDPTELILARLWAELLGVEEVQPEDNFFELGGHSLLAARLVDEMERELGARLPLTAVITEATVAGMARLLREQRRQAPRVVPLNSSGARPPLFFLHGDFNGGGYYAARIAKVLGEEQPFYLVHPFGAFDDEVPATVDGMVRRYVEAIRAERPEGPYRLAGFCTGGIIAHEVARRLVAAGARVDRLVLVDARARNVRLAGPYDRLGRLSEPLLAAVEERARRPLLAAAWLERRLRESRKLSLQGRLRYFSQKVRRDVGRISVDLPAAASPSRAEALVAVYTRRFAVHVPRPYPGPMVTIWPERALERDSWGPKGGWSGLATRIDESVTPGNHLTCLTDHWRALADRIAAALEGPGTS